MRKWRSLERKKCWASLGDTTSLNSFRKPAQTESGPCPSDFFYFAEFENLPQDNSKKKEMYSSNFKYHLAVRSGHGNPPAGRPEEGWVCCLEIIGRHSRIGKQNNQLHLTDQWFASDPVHIPLVCLI